MTLAIPMFLDDDDDIRMAVRSLMDRYSSFDAVRKAESGEYVQTWQQLVDGGWHMLAVPEALGGMGVGATELNYVLFELGRACAPAPFRTAAVGVATFLAHSFPHDPSAQLIIRRIEEGEVWVSVTNETNGLSQAPYFDGEALHGTIPLARDTEGAMGLVVASRAKSGRVAWVSVDTDSSGYHFTRQDSLGEGNQTSLEFDASPAKLIVEAGEESLQAWLTWRWFAEASYASGLMARALEFAVAHVSDREQFGRKIGSFQALQHKLADCAIGLQAVVNLCQETALTIDDTDGSAEESYVSAAEALEAARKGGRLVSTNVHQAMAGTGYSLEHDLQLVTRRLRSALLWGTDSETLHETIVGIRYPLTTGGTS